MLDRIRNRIRPKPEPATGKHARATRPRRVSRREREARQRRILYIVTAAALSIVAVALIGGASYQYIIYPRHALARVNGEKIERRDYWKVREVELRQNLAQIQSQLQFATGDQTTQLQQQAQLAQSELNNLHDAPVSSDTLGNMIDDVIVVQNLDDLGLTVTNAEVDQYLDEQFAPVPLIDPTATTTPNPTAAAWATATTEVQSASATAAFEDQSTAAAATSTVVSMTATALGTPQPTETPTVATTESSLSSATASASGTSEGTGTSVTTPGSTGTGTSVTTPVSTGTVTPAGTAVATGTGAAESGTPNGTETPEGTATPTGTATPDKNQSLATSQAYWDLYEKNFLKPAGVSRSEYKRLIARPAVARQKIQAYLLTQITDTADQVHAQHILVATEDAANQVEERLKTEDFAAVAKEVSTDASTAPNGGDLGWFAKGVMVEPFEEAAFSLQPGETSQPVQTQFGWHIIRVLEREANRPVPLDALQQEQQNSFQKWLDGARANSRIRADIAITSLTPATSPQSEPTFAPPPDAPPTPIPSPTTIPTPLPPVTPSN